MNLRRNACCIFILACCLLHLHAQPPRNLIDDLVIHVSESTLSCHHAPNLDAATAKLACNCYHNTALGRYTWR